jgi:hypothetical protein
MKEKGRKAGEEERMLTLLFFTLPAFLPFLL